MKSDKQRYIEAKRATLVSIAGNMALASFKLFAGIVGASSAVIADAMHSFSDIFSSIIIYIGLAIAGKKEDKIHPYGHGRAEVIAAVTVAFLLTGIAIAIWIDALKVLRAGQRPLPGGIALIAALVSIGVKEFLFRYKKHIGKKVGSESLIADAWHHRSDAFSSVATLIGVGGARLLGEKFVYLDPLAAMVIGIIIAGVGVKVFGGSAKRLMDAQGPDELLGRIRRSALCVPDVKGVEEVRARKSGLAYLVDIHVEVDREMSVEKSHRVAQEVRETVLAQMDDIKDLLVHIEPYYPGDH